MKQIAAVMFVQNSTILGRRHQLKRPVGAKTVYRYGEFPIEALSSMKSTVRHIRGKSNAFIEIIGVSRLQEEILTNFFVSLST